MKDRKNRETSLNKKRRKRKACKGTLTQFVSLAGWQADRLRGCVAAGWKAGRLGPLVKAHTHLI